MNMKHWWNDRERGKQKNKEKNLSLCYYVHEVTQKTGPKSNPKLRGDRLTTNLLSQGTAHVKTRIQSTTEIVCIPKTSRATLTRKITLV
jgi:hypothetical protein